jgi:hypothetical protein
MDFTRALGRNLLPLPSYPTKKGIFVTKVGI